MDESIPRRIGRYRIDRLLGAGAMGFVYLGHDPELARPVAIKTIRDLGMAPDQLKTFIDRFRNEARAAARLQHSSIVQVYDVGEDTEVGAYLVFEYVPGSTLKQILRERGPLPPAELTHLADQVADAIDIAHHEGIIHRDIKPDNLLVTETGKVKLADFGVARVPDAALTREGQFLGTPCYAAPETLRDGLYGPQTDLFSFAAVLYEAASGTRAFPGDDAVAVAHKVIHDEPPPPSTVAKGEPIGEAVDEVLMRGLSKTARARYGSAAELARELRAAYADQGLVPRERREPSTSVHTRPSAIEPAPRRSGMAFLLALAGLLSVGIAVVYAFGKPPDDEPTDLTTEPDAGVATPIVRERRDAGAEDAGAADAGPSAIDAGFDAGATDPLEGMDPHDREQRAKDALERARDAIIGGRFDDARRAIEEARRYDPENDEIAEIEARIPR
jgi:serine/threonine-protein kinase